MKYTFSEITRGTKNNTYGSEKKLIGKYFSQVFNENGEYVKIIIKDTYKEVVEEQKKIKEEK